MIGVALALYAVEFVADKIPWVDSVWDMAHTVVRPLGGAVVAIMALGSPSAGMDALAGALGASVALASHLTKAGTRAAANTSPEPFSNWILQLRRGSRRDRPRLLRDEASGARAAGLPCCCSR